MSSLQANARSPAQGKRSAGCLARARRMTASAALGMPGTCVITGGVGAAMCWTATASGVSAGYARFMSVRR